MGPRQDPDTKSWRNPGRTQACPDSLISRTASTIFAVPKCSVCVLKGRVCGVAFGSVLTRLSLPFRVQPLPRAKTTF